MNANFITSNGLVCKNGAERLLVVCLNVKYFWFESAGIDLNAVQCLRRTNFIKSIDLLKKIVDFRFRQIIIYNKFKRFHTFIQLS